MILLVAIPAAVRLVGTYAMRAIHVLGLLTLLTGLATAGCAAPASVSELRSAGLIDEKGRPSLGYLEHRGRIYPLNQLLDPEYRAASDDPFVREFRPQRIHANWAGL